MGIEDTILREAIYSCGESNLYIAWQTREQGGGGLNYPDSIFIGPLPEKKSEPRPPMSHEAWEWHEWAWQGQCEKYQLLHLEYCRSEKKNGPYCHSITRSTRIGVV